MILLRYVSEKFDHKAFFTITWLGFWSDWFWALHSRNSKESVCFCNCIRKHILSTKYYIAHHREEKWFYPIFNILLIGDTEEFIQASDAFCLTNKHVSCLYTLMKYLLSGLTSVMIGHSFDNMQRTVCSNQQKKKWTECRKEVLEEKL